MWQIIHLGANSILALWGLTCYPPCVTSTTIIFSLAHKKKNLQQMLYLYLVLGSFGWSVAVGGESRSCWASCKLVSLGILLSWGPPLETISSPYWWICTQNVCKYDIQIPIAKYWRRHLLIAQYVITVLGIFVTTHKVETI